MLKTILMKARYRFANLDQLKTVVMKPVKTMHNFHKKKQVNNLTHLSFCCFPAPHCSRIFPFSWKGDISPTAVDIEELFSEFGPGIPSTVTKLAHSI